MSRNRIPLWRRLVGLALLACLGLSSVEVVWADEAGESPAPTLDRAASTTVASDAPADPGPGTDCACLCACACANAQQVTPAVLPASLAPNGPPSGQSAASPGRMPRATLPQPHLRPPIA